MPPRQQKLTFTAPQDRMPKKRTSPVPRYTTANRECARLILANVEQYGKGSLPVEWANKVMGE